MVHAATGNRGAQGLPVTTGHEPDHEPALDPVCGMKVDRARGRSGEHDGARFFFCSEGCAKKFGAAPERYLHPEKIADAKAAPAEAPPAGALYICPMDAEVVAHAPGPCPVCGMSLEPAVIESGDASEGPGEEERDLTRRLAGSALATVPLVVVAMTMRAPWTPLVSLLLAAPVVLWGGAPFFARAWRSLLIARANMFTLVAVGSGVAFSYSALVTVHLLRGDDVYFEAAAVIVTLVLAGQVLEARARRQMTRSVRALLDLAPKMARLVPGAAGGEERDVLVSTLVPGDQVRVRPGERVPTDGRVASGTSSCDESLMTGEATPVAKSAGDRLIGGSLNGGGPLVMAVVHVGAATELARIVGRVRQAQLTRLPLQATVDRISAVFVPAVILVACATFVTWLALGATAAESLVRAVSVLVIACPCALGLATPVAVTAGIGRATTFGLVVRDAEALERIATVDTIVFDKTGTLTRGRPDVVAVCCAAGVDEAYARAVAAALEVHGEHPLAAAIVRAAAPAAIADLGAVIDVAVHVGGGISGTLGGAGAGGTAVVVGTEALLEARGVESAELRAAAAAGTFDRWRASGATVVHVARGGRWIAALSVTDTIKESAAATVHALAAEGLRLLLVSGDHLVTARAVAAAIGIAEGNVHGGASPADKDDLLMKLRGGGGRPRHRVAMVGDGVNDAPALARADASIAIGHGGAADVAIAAAGLTLLGEDLRGVVRARRLGVLTRRTIRQNVGLAFVYNLVAVPLAAGVFGRSLAAGPMVAAAAMTASSLCVLGNALRLRIRPL